MLGVLDGMLSVLGSRSRKSPPGSFPGTLGFDFPIPGRRRRHELPQKITGHLGHLLDGVVESRLIVARGSGGSADFSHVLQRRAPDLVFGGRWLEIEQGADVAAHRTSIAGRPRFQGAELPPRMTGNDKKQPQYRLNSRLGRDP
jgi:hypothetical protein